MSLFNLIQNLFRKDTPNQNVEGLIGLEKADAIFHNLVLDKKVPGMAITVLRHGEIHFLKGYGYSDLDASIPVDPKNSIFRIASISKCITGLAFGKMVEDGTLNWDDSFYKHVPNYPKKRFDFTLRQLASHTAGIRGYRGKEYALNEPYSIEESTIVFKNDPLIFEPGTGYLYNSFDFVLLSLAMQNAVGRSFEDYVRENVLLPLGMKNTSIPNGSDAHGVTEFYTKTAMGFKKAIAVNNLYKLAGGGYLSTSGDIAKMGQAILDRRLLKKTTYDELFNAQVIKDRSTYYGLGFQVSQDAYGRNFVGHVGNSVGAYTNFFVYPDEDIVFSIFINCTQSKVQDDLDKAIDAIISGNELA